MALWDAEGPAQGITGWWGTVPWHYGMLKDLLKALWDAGGAPPLVTHTHTHTHTPLAPEHAGKGAVPPTLSMLISSSFPDRVWGKETHGHSPGWSDTHKHPPHTLPQYPAARPTPLLRTPEAQLGVGGGFPPSAPTDTTFTLISILAASAPLPSARSGNEPSPMPRLLRPFPSPPRREGKWRRLRGMLGVVVPHLPSLFFARHWAAPPPLRQSERKARPATGAYQHGGGR